MSERRDLGEVFASGLVRHSIELASTLWGVTICVLDTELRPHFPAVAPLQLQEMLKTLLSARHHRREFQANLSPLFVGTPDWTGPRWFNPVPGVRQLVTPIGGAAGTTHLLCIPFVYFEETEGEEHAQLESLEKSLREPLVRGSANMVSSLSALAKRKLQTHMSTLSREMDTLLSKAVRRAGDLPRGREAVPGLVGASAQLGELKRRVRTLASDQSPLLVVGEQGTGKRTVAQTIHVLGGRKSQPLVVIDTQSSSMSEMLAAFLGRNWKYGDTPELERTAGRGTVLSDNWNWPMTTIIFPHFERGLQLVESRRDDN